MKKILTIIFAIILFVPTYSLRISRISQANFGEVVKGDKRVVLRNLKVEVKGEPGRKVKIKVPDIYSTDVGDIIVKVEEDLIIIPPSGKGNFKLECKLNLNKGMPLGKTNNKIPIRVSYRK